MEFQLSTYSMRTGDPRGAPETFAATQQLGAWSSEILRIPLNRLEIAIERSFNNMLEWQNSFYTWHKVFQLVGADQKPIIREINAPYFNEVTQAWETLNDLGSIKANYRIKLGSTMPAQSIYELQVLQQLSQQQPALIGEVLKRLPGLRESERQEIMQTIDTTIQLQQANEGQGQTIKVLQNQISRLQEMIAGLQRERAVSEVEPEIAKFVADMKFQRRELQRAVRDVKKNGKAKAQKG
jgi:hypothetical protein